MTTKNWRNLFLVLPLMLAALACNLGNAAPTQTAAPTAIIPTVFITAQPNTTAALPTATTATAPNCTTRSDWYAYRVQSGDTISVLAQRTGSTSAEIVAANCLSAPDKITVGSLLYLPSIPATFTPAPQASMGDLGIDPSLGQSIADRGVHAGQTVTLRIRVQNVTDVTFRANEQGHLAHTLGISANPTDVAELLWQVPNDPGLVLFLSADGVGPNGQIVSIPAIIKVTIVE